MSSLTLGIDGVDYDYRPKTEMLKGSTLSRTNLVIKQAQLEAQLKINCVDSVIISLIAVMVIICLIVQTLIVQTLIVQTSILQILTA